MFINKSTLRALGIKFLPLLLKWGTVWFVGIIDTPEERLGIAQELAQIEIPYTTPEKRVEFWTEFLELLHTLVE